MQKKKKKASNRMHGLPSVCNYCSGMSVECETSVRSKTSGLTELRPFAIEPLPSYVLE